MTSPADPDPDKPGKIRTWWHPLLAGFLRWQLGSHYDVREEVPVGKKPLQIDFLLLHKTQGELSDHARTLLAGLAEYLNEYTLVELKSPSDTLRAGDFRTLLAYALLFCSQQQETLKPARMNLIVIAPRLTRPYEKEMRLLAVRAGHLAPRQGIDDRLGMDLFLDVDGHDGHGQLGAVLLVLVLPDELRIARRIARVEHGAGRVLVVGHEIAQLLGGDVLALVLVADGFDGGGSGFLLGHRTFRQGVGGGFGRFTRTC
jgi:hypothetical protein